ncbi:hypothetical protein V6Z12_A10G163700 [Gossypium hirsutum]
MVSNTALVTLLFQAHMILSLKAFASTHSISILWSKKIVSLNDFIRRLGPPMGPKGLGFIGACDKLWILKSSPKVLAYSQTT